MADCCRLERHLVLTGCAEVLRVMLPGRVFKKITTSSWRDVEIDVLDSPRLLVHSSCSGKRLPK